MIGSIERLARPGRRLRTVARLGLSGVVVVGLALAGTWWIVGLRMPSRSLVFVPLIRPAIGERAPDFALKDIHGAVFHLGAHRGRAVVVEFGNIT